MDTPLHILPGGVLLTIARTVDIVSVLPVFGSFFQYAPPESPGQVPFNKHK